MMGSEAMLELSAMVVGGVELSETELEDRLEMLEDDSVAVRWSKPTSGSITSPGAMARAAMVSVVFFSLLEAKFGRMLSNTEVCSKNCAWREQELTR